MSTISLYEMKRMIDFLFFEFSLYFTIKILISVINWQVYIK
jgi:hypothetical protein